MALVPALCRSAMILNVNEPETRGLALALQTMLDDLGKGERRGHPAVKLAARPD